MTIFALIELAPPRLVSAVVVFLVAAVAGRLVHVVWGRVIQRVASRRLSGLPTRWSWKTRLPRDPRQESLGSSEVRRQHRIDATALALSRLSGVAIWLTAGVALLHLYGISVSVAVGSAGFVGLIIALGAQTSVSDYVTGLHILLEDRFGAGDEVELLTVNGRLIRGVVVSHGMFATRLESNGSTHHVANRMMSEVTNHSQLGVVTTIEVDLGTCPESVLTAAAAEARGSKPSMPFVKVDRVESELGDGDFTRSKVHLRASRSLGITEQHHFADHLRRLVAESGTHSGHSSGT